MNVEFPFLDLTECLLDVVGDACAGLRVAVAN